MIRKAITAAALALAVGAWARPEVPKEHVRIQLRTLSGAPVRVRIITRGLILIAPPSGARPQWQVITTVTTPTEVALAGVGEADLRMLDTTTSLVAEVTQVRPGSLPPQRLSGQGFRVTRTNYTEPFGVTNLELPGRD